MTDQLKIDAMNSAEMMTKPATVDSWKAKRRPSDARNLGKNSGAMGSAPHSMVRRGACKILTALLAMAAVSSAGAADGPAYDVFGRALAPIAAAVFGSTDGKSSAMVAECLVQEGTGALAPAAGTRLRIAVQAPDRLRVDVVRGGTSGPLTACRDGKEFWAVPVEPMTALAQAAGLDTDAAPADTASAPLIPLGLNAQMLAFLPLVFDVKDLGSEGNPARQRVLEFGLLPQLRESLHAGEFTGRAWIGEDDKPARLKLTTPQGDVDLVIEKLDFADQLSPTAWQAPAGQDALRLPASALNGLFGQMIGGSSN